MLPRINFLLGLGLSTVIALYFVGTYLVLLPLSVVAPDWVKPAAGIALLVSAGILVQILSTVTSGMAGVATYPDAGGPGALAIASQTAILCGHFGLVYRAAEFFTSQKPVTDPALLVIATVYLAGIAIAIQDWRQRDPAAK